jgi:transposase
MSLQSRRDSGRVPTMCTPTHSYGAVWVRAPALPHHHIGPELGVTLPGREQLRGDRVRLVAAEPAPRRKPPLEGQVERRTHDYTRHGTTTLFAALNAKSGKVISEFPRRQRARESRKFLDTIHARVPATLGVHLILDNSSTHKTAAIHRGLARHPRFHLHFTPTGASWINLVERWFAALTEKQLRRGVHRSTRELETAIRRYVAITNGHAKPFVWTKAADDILESVARFCHRISNSGH